jgi:lipopolysaccharide biosynthesis glycosyltransferase
LKVVGVGSKVAVLARIIENFSEQGDLLQSLKKAITKILKTLFRNRVTRGFVKFLEWVSFKITYFGVSKPHPKALDKKLTDALTKGRPLEDALIAHIRVGYEPKNRINTRAMLQTLVESPATKTLGSLGFGTFLALDGLYDSAMGYFKDAGLELAKQKAPFEYFDTLLTINKRKGMAEAREILDNPTSGRSSAYKTALIRALIKHHEFEGLRRYVEGVVLAEGARPTLGEKAQLELKWWHKLLQDDGSQVKPIKGAINFAVMDYNMLDYTKTSSNRGDYVQTLAAISNLLRHQNVEFVGGSALAKYLDKIQKFVNPERRTGEGSKKVKVQPVELNRDFASGRQYPENTWLISNGWFMHRPYKGEVDFPYPANINPIMVSFHIQDPDVLTAKTVEELKKIGPIGCRDWTTVYRLRDYGVPAFFSGCVTTTVGQVLPKAKFGGKIPRLAVVEAKVPSKYLLWWKKRFIQIGDHVRDFTLVEGIEDARQMLAEYHNYGHVITKRLHCYLPARSMGLPVTFTPGKRSDVRFEGLLDLNETDFNKIRHGLEYKLEVITTAILAGKSRDEVMAIWRELVAPDLKAAEVYCTKLEPIGKPEIDLAKVYGKFDSHVMHVGNNKFGKKQVHLAFAVDQNLKEELAVVLASVVRNTDRQINAHVLTRGLGEEYWARLHKLFPQVNFHFHDFSYIDYGSSVNLMSHITVSTFDRLFLPRVLKDVAKVLYLDVDILVRGDVGELYDLNVKDHVFAGKKSRLDGWSNLVHVITRVSLRLPAQQAWALRRRAHETGKLSADTYNAGVLLMNLNRMRKDEFIENHLYLVEKLHLNDQDVMNFYSKGKALRIGDEWNFVPTQDYAKDPKIVHFAGPVKPWKPQNSLYKSEFQAIVRELKQPSK